MAKKKVLPQVYFDEHIKPPVVDEFREAGSKCVMIANTKGYAGREEQDYKEEIYAEGKPFVTSDSEFVDDHVLEHNVKHAGIILIPKVYNDASARDHHTALAEIAKIFIKEFGRNALRRHIIYIAEDGFRVLDDKGEDYLLASFLPEEQTESRWCGTGVSSSTVRRKSVQSGRPKGRRRVALRAHLSAEDGRRPYLL